MNFVALIAILLASFTVIQTRVLDGINSNDNGQWYLDKCQDSLLPVSIVPHYPLTVEYTDSGSSKQLNWESDFGSGKIGGKIVQDANGDSSSCEIRTTTSGVVDSLLINYAAKVCNNINSLEHDGDKVVVRRGDAYCSYVREKPSDGLLDNVVIL